MWYDIEIYLHTGACVSMRLGCNVGDIERNRSFGWMDWAQLFIVHCMSGFELLVRKCHLLPDCVYCMYHFLWHSVTLHFVHTAYLYEYVRIIVKTGTAYLFKHNKRFENRGEEAGTIYCYPAVRNGPNCDANVFLFFGSVISCRGYKLPLQTKPKSLSSWESVFPI